LNISNIKDVLGNVITRTRKLKEAFLMVVG